MNIEASHDKLGHYADIYGKWILGLTPCSARCIAQANKDFSKIDPFSSKAMQACAEAVHFEAIATALEQVIFAW